MEHLSDLDVFLFLDKELSEDRLEQIQEHLKSCKKCSEKIQNSQIFSELIRRAAEKKMSLNRTSDCISDLEFTEYLGGHISTTARMKIENHLSTCEYCLSILCKTKEIMKENSSEDLPHQILVKSTSIVKKSLRMKKVVKVIDTFSELIKKRPQNEWDFLQKVEHDFETIIKSAFTYPYPRFSPVFGESQIGVISPFGKVRYPIVFEWQPVQSANLYEISIKDIEWFFKTEETRVIITEEQLKRALNHDKEIMWIIKAKKHNETLEEESGFFSLITPEEKEIIEEIEVNIKKLAQGDEKFIIWGGLLESSGLLMEAIEKYKQLYSKYSSPSIAYFIASCYDKLELEDLREKWNNKIPQEN